MPCRCTSTGLALRPRTRASTRGAPGGPSRGWREPSVPTAWRGARALSARPVRADRRGDRRVVPVLLALPPKPRLARRPDRVRPRGRRPRQPRGWAGVGARSGHRARTHPHAPPLGVRIDRRRTQLRALRAGLLASPSRRRRAVERVGAGRLDRRRTGGRAPRGTSSSRTDGYGCGAASATRSRSC